MGCSTRFSTGSSDSVTSWLKTLMADAFYWTDNDLVVQTRSMYGGSLRGDGAANLAHERPLPPLDLRGIGEPHRAQALAGPRMARERRAVLAVRVDQQQAVAALGLQHASREDLHEVGLPHAGGGDHHDDPEQRGPENALEVHVCAGCCGPVPPARSANAPRPDGTRR